uniref:Cyclic nucleotide-binding domain-containing protein n=1 Tax=Macrostomum lignano TaxID=282301 RepID=A0A1I8ILM0_9PLAT
MYIILTGMCDIRISSADTTEEDDTEATEDPFEEGDVLVKKKPAEIEALLGVSVGTFKAGHAFGEVALVSGVLRTASVIVNPDSDICQVLVIDKSLFDRTLQDYMRREEAGKANFIEQFSHFSTWPVKFRQQLLRGLSKTRFKYSEQVMRQGDEIDCVYFITSGEVKQSLVPGLHREQYSRHPLNERLKGAGRCRDWCCVSKNEVIGGLEVVLGMKTYLCHGVATMETNMYRLNLREWTRLQLREARAAAAALDPAAAASGLGGVGASSQLPPPPPSSSKLKSLLMATSANQPTEEEELDPDELQYRDRCRLLRILSEGQHDPRPRVGRPFLAREELQLVGMERLESQVTNFCQRLRKPGERSVTVPQLTRPELLEPPKEPACGLLRPVPHRRTRRRHSHHQARAGAPQGSNANFSSFGDKGASRAFLPAIGVEASGESARFVPADAASRSGGSARVGLGEGLALQRCQAALHVLLLILCPRRVVHRFSGCETGGSRLVNSTIARALLLGHRLTAEDRVERIVHGLSSQLLPQLLPFDQRLALSLPLLLIADRALVEQLLIHLHEQLERIVNQSVNCLVPVLLGSVQCREHDRHGQGGIVGHQGQDVLIVPVVQRPFSHLEVRRAHAPGQLAEQRPGDLAEFDRVNNVENLFELGQEHHLLGRVDLRPEAQQA